MSEPPPAAPPSPFRSSRTLIPRCPRCLYALEGHPEEGACPECGAGYLGHERFLYHEPGGFWRTFGRFTWPVLLTPLLFVGGFVGPGGETLIFGMFWLLLIVLLANCTWASYRWIRRRRILRMSSGEAFVATPGIYLTSLGCGLLAASTIAVVTFGVACGGILLIFIAGGY